MANEVTTKRSRGNPAMRKGAPSLNPSGRPKVAEEFRARCRKAVDEHCITAWVDEVTPRVDEDGNKTRGKEWVRCSELLSAYAYGKPASVSVVPGDDDGEGLTITIKKLAPEEV